MAVETMPSTVAKSVLDAAITSGIERLLQALRVSKENFRLQLGLAFEQHLSATYRRFSKIRTILTKEKLVDFSEIYVSLRLKAHDEIISDSDLMARIPSDAKVLVEGTGGAGKSMLLRYFAMSHLDNPVGKVPVFVELRSLNFNSNSTLDDLIFENISSQGSGESHYTFLKALGDGIVVLFLDGLDEVPSAKRDAALDKINSFASRNPRHCIIISSRPGNSRNSLPLFELFKVQPLSLRQAVDVVSRSSAERAKKQAFISKLESGLFKEHETLLGIPLLVVMMLLTYSRYSDIPDRMSVFYEQAFSTLYALHDSESKGPYKRDHYAALAPDQFRRVFENFCYLSLSQERYQFLYHEAIDLLLRSTEYSEIKCNPEEYLKDLEESVCLIIHEGIDYLFSHRSFQEHFPSKFALRFSGEDRYRVIDKIIGFEFQHNTLTLMSEIDGVGLREFWIVPALIELKRLIEQFSENRISKALSLFFPRYDISTSQGNYDQRLNNLTIGYPRPSNEEGLRVRRLAAALSRVTQLPQPFVALCIPTALPSDKKDFQSLISKLSQPNRNLENVFRLMFPSDLEEQPLINPEGMLHESLEINDEAEEWLTQMGASKILDTYLAKLEEVLREQEELVASHKLRESALF